MAPVLTDAAGVANEGGTVDPAFERVRTAFRGNFAAHGELGAAVSVWIDGRPVVDLWGGWANPARREPWRQHTIVCMMSICKGVAALCAHKLIERGVLDLEAPVAEYWPEFAAGGKARLTVRQLLGHHAGLIYPDGAPPGSFFDFEIMTAAMAAQAPEWPPGTRGAYHSATYGILIGELVRRADGRRVGRFMAEEIAAPLGLDYHFGVPEADLGRLAEIVPNAGSVTINLRNDPTTKAGRAWRPMTSDEPSMFNDIRFRTGELPEGSGLYGHGNARAIGRLFAALARGGEIDGVRLLRRDSVDRLRTVQWAEACGLYGRAFRMGLGLFLNSPSHMPMGPNPDSFGHAGAGGALGFADPARQLAFAYSPNQMCAGTGVGERCDALVEATYACL
jgi:CubicO group peptidase (beta-lactamase class C family)